MAPPILERDGSFYCTLVTIQAESCLFKVPRELFELYSEVFLNMFSLPRVGGPGEVQDGDQDDKPLFLDGIKKDDFRAFLTVLCSLHYETVTTGKVAGKTNLLLTRFPQEPYYTLIGTQWVAVLRLSHTWGFDNVKTKAISMIESMWLQVGMIQRLKLAQELHIPHWIRPAYQYLMTRDVELNASEVPWLGDNFVQKVTTAREERTKLFLLRILTRETPIPPCPLCQERTLKLTDLTTSSNSQVASPNHRGAAEAWSLHCPETSLRHFYSSTVGPNANKLFYKTSWTVEELYQVEYAKQPANALMMTDIDRLIDRFLPIS